MPEEHCKYTKQSSSSFFCFFSSLAFAFHTLLSHCSDITHIMWCKEYAFLQRCRELSSTPYVSLLSVKKVFSLFCLKASMNVWFHRNVKYLLVHYEGVFFFFFFSCDSCFMSCRDCMSTICIKRHKHLKILLAKSATFK